MLRIFDLSYCALPKSKSDEVFTLRKETFHDRLNWTVRCTDGMEFDEYDNQNTTYLFGIKNDTMLCSVRFIEMKYPNMITHTFFRYFDRFDLPKGNYIESSRFFVDKARAKNLLGTTHSLSTILFLSMVNYARHFGYDGIITLVSHPMLIILQRSGWNVSVLATGSSEKSEPVYILLLPIDSNNQNTLIDRILTRHAYEYDVMKQWPLCLE